MTISNEKVILFYGTLYTKKEQSIMKPAILIPIIIIGSVLLVAGGVLIDIGVKNNRIAPRVTNTYTINENFSNFDINIDTADLAFKVSEDNSNKVVCEETEKDKHEVSVFNNTLTIKYHDERKWHEKIFNFNFARMKVTVYLTELEFDSLKINMSTGDVSVPNNFTFNSVNTTQSTGDCHFNANIVNESSFKTTTGYITMENMNAPALNLNVTTGDISLKNVHVTNNIQIDITTGRINLDSVTAKNYKSVSSTGMVVLKDTVIENEINIRTSTGDVRFDRSDATTLDIETSTGDVTGTFLTSKIFHVETSTGSIDVPPTTEGGLCKIKTSTGDVSLNIVQ